MSRKDYELIALAISLTRESYDGTGAASALDDVSWRLAYALRGDNPNFDRAKFLTACGVKP